MNDQEKQFTKGFNNGYFIAKYQPDLFGKIEKNNNLANEYFQGLVSGKNEHEKEKKMVYMNELKNKKSQKPKTKDLEKEK